MLTGKPADDLPRGSLRSGIHGRTEGQARRDSLEDNSGPTNASQAKGAFFLSPFRRLSGLRLTIILDSSTEDQYFQKFGETIISELTFFTE